MCPQMVQIYSQIHLPRIFLKIYKIEHIFDLSVKVLFRFNEWFERDVNAHFQILTGN
jgi:hypothetical protein